jgi:uncharacterized protein YdhG (YjbR/CyaY superfamily)
LSDSDRVDAYLAALPDDRRAALERLRETIRAAAPEAVETISYDMPAFRAHGRILVYYAAFRDHFSLFPAGGAVLDALGPEVARFRSGKGTLRFAWDEPLPVALLTKIVQARLAENAGRRRR